MLNGVNWLFLLIDSIMRSSKIIIYDKLNRKNNNGSIKSWSCIKKIINIT
jgi:hypothetical protein